MEKPYEINFFYLSAKEFSSRTGLGYKDVLYQCEKGSFDCFLTEGGQWRIKVIKNENGKELDRLREENAALKNSLANIMSVVESCNTSIVNTFRH